MYLFLSSIIFIFFPLSFPFCISLFPLGVTQPGAAPAPLSRPLVPCGKEKFILEMSGDNF